jgi:hypothetical protein
MHKTISDFAFIFGFFCICLHGLLFWVFDNKGNLGFYVLIISRYISSMESENKN